MNAMQWHSASEFFAMGGYATYVWGSYAVTALVLVFEPWLIARHHRRAVAQARAARHSGVRR